MSNTIDKYLPEEYKALTEAIDKEIQDIGDIINGKTLMSIGTIIEKMFGKKNVIFAFSPVPHYRIKSKGKTIILVHKKYADKPDLIVGEIAIGYEGKI